MSRDLQIIGEAIMAEYTAKFCDDDLKKLRDAFEAQHNEATFRMSEMVDFFEKLTGKRFSLTMDANLKNEWWVYFKNKEEAAVWKLTWL